MASYPIPTWLQPADLPSAYAKGIALGAQIGEQVTRTRLAEAEMRRREEENAQQRAYQDAALALKIKEQMRSVQAQDEYRRLVEGGMDPMKALQMLGPQLRMTGGQLSNLFQASQPQKAEFIVDPKTGRSFVTRGKSMLPSGIVPNTSQTEPVMSKDERFYRKPDGSWAPMPGVGAAEARQTAMDLRERITRRMELNTSLNNARKQLDLLPVGDPAAATLQAKINRLTAELDKLGLPAESEPQDELTQQPSVPTPKSRYTIIEAK